MYPVMLSLRGRSCLVVGGGGVALRKVQGLLAEGAQVTVVAPAAIPPLRALADEGRIRFEERSYRTGELSNYSLGFAATDDRRVNRQVYWDGENANIWVNVSDDPDICSFHVPARIQRGSLQLVIASEGLAPFVVRRLKRVFEKILGPEWREWIDAAARFRKRIRACSLRPDEEQAAFDRFFDRSVDEDRLTVRIPSPAEEEAWIGMSCQESGLPAPSAATLSSIDGRGGFVSLVGAGPGDPGLLAVRGEQRLQSANAVVYDHLAETVLPPGLPAEVELHPVGKKAGYHPVAQEMINGLIIRLAREGKRVVRLKGGDPFVFGRGGEEAEALVEAAIPFEVIPCVTAATAVSAYAGIPVTYRQESVQLSLVTAHECDKEKGPQVRWDLLAKEKHATIVGYMGVTSLPAVVKTLVQHGMSPETPAAVIERGTTSRQRTVYASLHNLADKASRAGIKPPAIFVLGPSVIRAEELNWFSCRPLFGSRIVFSKSHDHLVEEIELAGAEVIRVPLPLTPASLVVINALPLSAILFGTEDEVELLEELQGRAGITVYCTGRDVARRAREYGWPNSVELPDEIGAPELIECIRRNRTAGNRLNQSLAERR